MTASTETERGPAAGTEAGLAEADRAYRTIRAYMFLSAAWFLLIALVLALLDVAGWRVYLGLVMIAEGIGIPLFLHAHRRELDERIGGGGGGPVIDDDRR
jgi:hypothetical protein